MDSFVVYTKSGCLYCDMIKDLLKEYKVKYINCDKVLIEDKELFLDHIKSKIGFEYRCFPMVFCGDQFVGGYKETQFLLAQCENQF